MPEGSTDTDDQGLSEDEEDDEDDDEEARCDSPADIFRARSESLPGDVQTR